MTKKNRKFAPSACFIKLIGGYSWRTKQVQAVKKNTILTTQKQKRVIGVICGNFKFRLQYRKYNSRPSIIKKLSRLFFL